MKTQFNRTNQQELWKLREYHGYASIKCTRADALGRMVPITGEHADRLIGVGQTVYADVPDEVAHGANS